MRKICFAFFLTFFAFNVSALDFITFRGIDFISSTATTLYQEDNKDSKIKIDSGLKLNFSNLMAFLSLGIPSTAFSDFSAEYGAFNNWDDFNQKTNLRYGCYFNVPGNEYFNMKISAGTLVFGNGITRLRNPTLSVSSGLKSPNLPPPGIGASLPDVSSAEKPFSLSLDFSPKMALRFMPEIEFGATSEKEFYASVFKNFSVPVLGSIAMALNVGSFVYGKDYSDSWMQICRPFLEDRFLSGNLEFYLSRKNLKMFLSLAATQNPFGGFQLWSRGSASFVSPALVVNSAFFVSDYSLVTASAQRPHVLLELQLNPWGRFSVGNSRLNLGLFFQLSAKETDKIIPENFFDFVFQFDGNMKTSGRTNSLNASYRYSTLDGGWSFGAGTSFSVLREKFSVGANASYKLENEKSTMQAGLSFSPKKSMLNSVSVEAKGSVKGDKISSTSLQAAVSLKKAWNFGSVSLKLAMISNF